MLTAFLMQYLALTGVEVRLASFDRLRQTIFQLHMEDHNEANSFSQSHRGWFISRDTLRLITLKQSDASDVYAYGFLSR